MSFFPLFLQTNKARFLVIGAGNVGVAKLQTILEFTNNVVVLSQKTNEESKSFIEENNIDFIQGDYKKKHLESFDVIIGATNDEEVNKQISEDAKKLGKLISVVDDPDKSNFIFGAIIKKKNITAAISTSGMSPVLARFLKNKLVQNLPQNLEIYDQFISKNRTLVKNKLTDLQARRIFWQEVFEGEIGNQIEQINLQKAQKLLEEKLNSTTNKKQSAVYFIGAGPGDPELITLKAIKLLSKADVVLYDRLVANDILQYARKDAIKINVGKVKSFHRYEQNEIGNLIRKYASQGNIVARLKGGDPSIFARLEEEIDAILDLKIPYQIVPAVSSALGAAACSGISLTSRNVSRAVRFLTLYKEDFASEECWQDLAKTKDTLVFYMSAANLGLICQNLVKFGKNSETQIAVIEQATTKFQKTFVSQIGNFEQREFVSPSLAIIGDVVAGYEKYKWQEENLLGEYFSKLQPRGENAA
ncbi:MAG: uroporphyrin-III C-methyltransferase/precorrin-2 dehydrogenase/sirohydrochlorin ferrochelatase [Rickettsiales bacterium]|jgi:uroporphyrin-III C-methyltransferase/precorrin-2 dehydrogenase/sirohydrochlorin ferrochelatase